MLYIVVFRTRLFEFPEVRDFLILYFVSITLISHLTFYLRAFVRKGTNARVPKRIFYHVGNIAKSTLRSACYARQACAKKPTIPFWTLLVCAHEGTSLHKALLPQLYQNTS